MVPSPILRGAGVGPGQILRYVKEWIRPVWSWTGKYKHGGWMCWLNCYGESWGSALLLVSSLGGGIDCGAHADTLIGSISHWVTGTACLEAMAHWYDINLPHNLNGTDHLEEDDGIALRLLNAVSLMPKFIPCTINERLVLGTVIWRKRPGPCHRLWHQTGSTVAMPNG
jgi:hypothetical protein